ncbi:MAG: hypothetical protein M3295_00775 [Chloroflexota bacterium]|nr:hypothetical protein [Chloroflexota bacterium]
MTTEQRTHDEAHGAVREATSFLSTREGWSELVEVNPPLLPNMTHLRLRGTWRNVLVTDNPFQQVRVSPYAFAARITHDVPEVRPTVVASSRDRNILAIESEVRGALGNGVNSFLVVAGDVLPEVEHWANNYEIVEHLRALQDVMPSFEVGMSTRFREWMFRRRIAIGAQFFVTGPVMDPDVVERCAARLGLAEADPPVYLGVVPPFSQAWVNRIEGLGAVKIGDRLRGQLTSSWTRRDAWRTAHEAACRGRDLGFAGVVLMSMKFETIVGEAYEQWRAFD